MAPQVAGSVEELVAGGTDRVEVRTADAKSGARFERLRIPAPASDHGRDGVPRGTAGG